MTPLESAAVLLALLLLLLAGGVWIAISLAAQSHATMSSAPGMRMPASRPAACASISTQMPATDAAARTPAPK